MATVVGIWMALSGVLPALAGLTSLRRARRLRRRGVQAWAAAVPDSSPNGERGPALQYRLPNGRTLEKLGAGKAAALLPGERVSIWYDPAKPEHILVRGDDGRAADLVGVIAGALLMAAGSVIAIAAG
jgi:Protein of unknown function (DUF3592)